MNVRAQPQPFSDAGASPHSCEAEEHVIGGCLIDPSAWARIDGTLSGADFSHPAHRLIFEAISAVARTGSAPDVFLVSRQLDGSLEAIDGVGRLSELARETPTAANVCAYAGIVRERAVRGRAQAALRRHADRLQESETSAVLPDLERDLAQITADLPGAGDAARQPAAMDWLRCGNG